MELVFVTSRAEHFVRLQKEVRDKISAVWLFMEPDRFGSAVKYDLPKAEGWSGDVVRLDRDDVDGIFGEAVRAMDGGSFRYMFLVDLDRDDLDHDSLPEPVMKFLSEGDRCFVCEFGNRHYGYLADRFPGMAVVAGTGSAGFPPGLVLGSNPGFCRMAGIGADLEEYSLGNLMARVEDAEVGMAAARSELDGVMAGLSAYEAELAAETARLRAKHGWDGLEGRRKDLEAGIAEASAETDLDKFYAVASLVGSLVRFGGSLMSDNIKWLRDTWGVDVSWNSRVDMAMFPWYLKAYQEAIRTDAFRRENPLERDDTGRIEVSVSEVVSYGSYVSLIVPQAVLDGFGEFVASCSARSEATSREWSGRLLNNLAGDPERIASLRMAMPGT